MKVVFLISLIIVAIMAIETRKLRNAIIYLGIFSLLVAVVYLLQGAPDVAIAEAIIGSTMATILYIVAFQKYRIFTVYILMEKDVDDSVYRASNYSRLLTDIETFCTKNGLEMMPIYTVTKMEDIIRDHRFGLIIEHGEMRFEVLAHHENMKAMELLDRLEVSYVDVISRKLVDE